MLPTLLDNFKALEAEAVRKLASSDVKEGAEVLPELAYCFNMAGYSIDDFWLYREHLIQKAEILSENPQLLRMKLEIYEKEHREKRDYQVRCNRAKSLVQ